MKLEGNSLKSYKLCSLVIGLIVGFPFYLISAFTRFTTKSVGVAPPGTTPRVLVGFHQDFPVFMVSKQIWEFFSVREIAWVGAHSFLSYFPSLDLMLKNVLAIRYDRRKPDAYAQVLAGMKIVKGDIAIRTDSGGPYNVVRRSAIRFAVDSGRGLVGFRQKPNRYLRIYGHYFPLPFSVITSSWTRFYSHEELQTQTIDFWTKELQQAMEAL